MVECHSGSRYGERPRAFTWQGERLEVAEILGEWRTPEGRYFRVRTRDQQEFELAYREAEDAWTVRQR